MVEIINNTMFVVETGEPGVSYKIILRLNARSEY